MRKSQRVELSRPLTKNLHREQSGVRAAGCSGVVRPCDTEIHIDRCGRAVDNLTVSAQVIFHSGRFRPFCRPVVSQGQWGQEGLIERDGELGNREPLARWLPAPYDLILVFGQVEVCVGCKASRRAWGKVGNIEQVINKVRGLVNNDRL